MVGSELFKDNSVNFNVNAAVLFRLPVYDNPHILSISEYEFQEVLLSSSEVVKSESPATSDVFVLV